MDLIQKVLLISIVITIVLIFLLCEKRNSKTNLIKTYKFKTNELEEYNIHNEVFDITNNLIKSTILIRIHTTQCNDETTIIAEYNVKYNTNVIVLSILLILLIFTLIFYPSFKIN